MNGHPVVRMGWVDDLHLRNRRLHLHLHLLMLVLGMSYCDSEPKSAAVGLAKGCLLTR